MTRKYVLLSLLFGAGVGLIVAAVNVEVAQVAEDGVVAEGVAGLEAVLKAPYQVDDEQVVQQRPRLLDEDLAQSPVVVAQLEGLTQDELGNVEGAAGAAGAADAAGVGAPATVMSMGSTVTTGRGAAMGSGGGSASFTSCTTRATLSATRSPTDVAAREATAKMPS